MANKPPLISLVIPCKNEEKNVVPLVAGINGVFERKWGRQFRHEIILVNDNSTDSTGGLMAKVAKKDRNVRIVQRRDGTPGVGRAFRDGFKVARGDYVMTLDSDFSHDPREIPNFLEAASAGHDFMLGSRYGKQGRADMPLLRQVISRGYNLFVRLLLGLPFPDSTTGFRMVKSSILRHVRTKSNGFDVHPELNIKCWRLATSPVEVPIHYYPRAEGKSKLKYVRELAGYSRVFLTELLEHGRF